MSQISRQSRTPAFASAVSPGVKKVKPDLLVLTSMAHQLSLTLQQLDAPMSSTEPWFSSFQDCHKRSHRIALYQPHELLRTQCLSFVGFVSGRQPTASASICTEIERIDALMVAELVAVPGMFSYSSLEVRSGHWYNLVIFSTAATKTHFKKSQTHSYAAYQLAPQYYAWIRLHNGLMPAGLAQQELRLQSTRYYTFQQGRQRPDMYEMLYGNP